MMVYYLLRNNKESGPFTLKELKELPVLTTDLIWINGESTSWKTPDEIPELHGLAKATQGGKQPLKTETAVAASVSYTATTHSPTVFSPNPATGPAEDQAFVEEPLAKPSFEELKQKYAARAPRKKVWKSQINIGANLMGIATLVIGVSTAAFMIKKAVDNIEPDPIVATADAVEIGSDAVYLSTSSQAALAPKAAAPAEPQSSATPETPAAGTALVEKKPTLEVPPQPATPVATKQEEKKKVIATQPADKPAPEKTVPVESTGEIAVAETKDRPEEAGEKKKKTPALQLTANVYKVGFLGGISNLELSVSNPGSQAIEKALVEVEYLKPNGKVVGTQTVSVNGLAANSSKKVAVPDNGRGVSVRYRVVEVED